MILIDGVHITDLAAFEEFEFWKRSMGESSSRHKFFKLIPSGYVFRWKPDFARRQKRCQETSSFYFGLVTGQRRRRKRTWFDRVAFLERQAVCCMNDFCSGAPPLPPRH